MKEWDVFISYASEDRESVVLPLASKLEDAGLRVWLDKLQLRIGDSLSRKIGRGLKKSRFGVIILSPAFFAKRWPVKELRTLMAYEADGQSTILPVLHTLSVSFLEEKYPMFLDRILGETQFGLDRLAHDIIDVVIHPESASPAVIAPSVRRLFITLIERTPSHEEIVRFLQAHEEIIRHAFGIHFGDIKTKFWGFSIIEWSPQFVIDHDEYGVHFTPDVYTGDVWGTSRTVEWKIGIFKTPSEPIFRSDGQLTDGIQDTIQHVQAFYDWEYKIRAVTDFELYELLLPRGSKLREYRMYMRSMETVIYVGRRSRLSEDERTELGRLNRTLDRIAIRTFDRLIEAAPLQAEGVE